MDDHSLPPGTEPCPTPQAWQEVLQQFQTEARTYEVDAASARVQVSELGQGPSLVFLPQTIGDRWLFALSAWLLKDEFHCVLIDHPQWDRLPAVTQLLCDTARVLAMVVEHACPNGAAFYGAGWGGQVALQLLHDHPELTRWGLLQGSWANLPLSASERRLLRLGTWSAGRCRRFPLWRRIQQHNHRPWFPPFDHTRFDFLLRQTGQERLRTVCHRFLAAAAADLRPLLPNITTPVLLLRCEGDGTTVAATMEELAAALPGAEVEELHMTGHYPYLTHPHRLAKVVRLMEARHAGQRTPLDTFPATARAR